MNFALEVTNPAEAILNKVLIDITVYTQAQTSSDSNGLAKTLQSEWKDRFHVRTAKPELTGTKPTFADNHVQQTTSLSIEVKANVGIKDAASSDRDFTDTYAIKFPYALDTVVEYAQSGTPTLRLIT